MSILTIFKDVFKRDFHPSDPSYWAKKFWYGGTESKAGVPVDEDTAMKYSAYSSGIRIISETIASMPLNIYEDMGDKGKRKATKHPLYSLLHDQPNPDMDSFTWRETAKVHVLGWGNHYSLLKRHPLYDHVIEIYPMEPWRVKPEMVNTPSFGRIKLYRYQPFEGPEVYLGTKDVLHIHGLSYNGIVGITPLTWYREQVGLGLAMEEYSARFFSNGMNASGVFTTPQTLKNDTYERLKAQLHGRFAGLSKSHNAMILEQELKFDKISINPNDAQLLESKKFQVEEIARILRIPLVLLGTSEPVSDNNVEHLGINFITYCLLPWIKRDEQAYNMQLFAEKDKGKYFSKIIVDGLLRGDTATRFESYTKAIQNGIYSPNNVLEMEDRNPYDGGEKHFIQLNMQSIEDIGQTVEPPAAPTNDLRAIESNSLTSKLTEKLLAAYKPLLFNALIRVIKREKTDVLKIIKDKFTTIDIENYYTKHKEFVSKQIKPVVYAFTEALGAENSVDVSDITIFSDSYSLDFTERFTENNIAELRATQLEQFELTFDEWLEHKPEELSAGEMLNIIKVFNKFIEKIGS